MIRETVKRLFALTVRVLETFGGGSQLGFAQVGESPTLRRGGHVVCYHPQAREIGESILAAGGNAFDAFVATTAAENVLSEGASSLAGALGVLIYRAEDGLVAYLDGDHTHPLD